MELMLCWVGTFAFRSSQHHTFRLLPCQGFLGSLTDKVALYLCRHGNAPAPPMIIVFTLVTSSVRARRAAPRLRPFRPSHEMDPQSAGRLQFLLAFFSGQRPKETLTTYRFPYFGLTADREFTIGHSDCAPRIL